MGKKLWRRPKSLCCFNLKKLKDIEKSRISLVQKPSYCIWLSQLIRTRRLMLTLSNQSKEQNPCIYKQWWVDLRHHYSAKLYFSVFLSKFQVCIYLLIIFFAFVCFYNLHAVLPISFVFGFLRHLISSSYSRWFGS